MIGDPQKKPPLAIMGYIALIPLAIGIIMLLTSLYDIIETRRLELLGSTATGTIVGEASQQVRSGYLYCPLVRFTAASGAVVQFRDNTCASVPHKRPDGAPVPVRYFAYAPRQSAAVDQGHTGYWLSAFTGVVGLLSVLLAVGIMRGLHRARRAFQLKLAGRASQGEPTAPR